jgi:hypothetical protein
MTAAMTATNAPAMLRPRAAAPLVDSAGRDEVLEAPPAVRDAVERVVEESVSSVVMDEKIAVEFEKPLGAALLGVADAVMVPLPAADALADA